MKNNLLEQKSKAFAIRIVKFYKYMCTEKGEYVLSKQILRSGTSIGANICESNQAQSSADFISKLNISLKEAEETCYWLDILLGGEVITQKEYDSIYSDAEELVKILVSSLKTLRAKS